MDKHLIQNPNHPFKRQGKDSAEAKVMAYEKKREHGWIRDGWIGVLKLNKSLYTI